MKLNKHAWILWGIALATVIVLMIAIPFVRTASWWIAAICTVAMFGLCAYAFHLAFSKNGKLESKLLGWPVFKVGYRALMAQLILGGIIMALSFLCPVWIAVAVEVLLFALTGAALTVKDAAREVVTQSETKLEDKTAGWKAIRARASAIAAQTGNADLKKLAETIRYADPMPTSMDSEIAQMLETLSSYADAENIRKAFVMMEQRKALAKGEKK